MTPPCLPDSESTHERTTMFLAGPLVPAKPMQELRDHFLVMVEGPLAGQRIQLGTKPLKIGRRAGCDWVVVDSEISGQHCEVSAKPYEAHAWVTDLQSTNGSFVEGKRVLTSARLPSGGLLQLGRQVFRHECVSHEEAEKARQLERDLDKARHYVQSLLPSPIREGPVRTDWFHLPSTQLGGDAFGYHQLGENTFAGYLVDVSGHGVGAAMHSVSVMNVLRQRALPHTDFHDPAQVLRSLNAMFQMDAHDGMYFTMWYGVYDASTRVLRYSSGGHHASYLVPASRNELVPLKTRNLLIGAVPDANFVAAQAQIPVGSTLYIFSDGVFEVSTRHGTQWGLEDFLPLLREPAAVAPQGSESERLYRAVREVARAGPLEDDFSMMAVTFL